MHACSLKLLALHTFLHACSLKLLTLHSFLHACSLKLLALHTFTFTLLRLVAYEVPEWKTKAMGKAVTYGMKDSRSMKDQRENLPIFRLKEQLISAVNDNQVRFRMDLVD